MSDELPPATRKFWHLKGVTAAREMRDHAVARLNLGDEIVEFHVHDDGVRCPGFATALLKTDEEGNVILPSDICWRAMSAVA